MLLLSGEINTLLTVLGPAPGGEERPERNSSSPPPPRGRPRPVMIIEDDPDILETLREILEYEGHDVVAISGGEEALLQLQAGVHPALILMDLMMPGVNGWGLAEHLRRDPSLNPIPIVILSGVQDIEQQAKSVGAAGCLLKPVQVERLLEIVNRYCR